MWGIQQEQSYELWVDDVNKAGGIKVGDETYMVELITYDHKYDPILALELANRLIFQDKVIAIGTNLQSTKPIMPLATENKIICWAHRMDPLLRPEWPYLFTSTPEPYETQTATYRWMVAERPEIKRVAIIAADDLSSQATHDILVQLYEELGFELVSTKFYPVGATDFYPYVSPAIAEKPDLIDTSGSYPEGTAGTVKAARELGFWGPILSVGMMPKVLIDIAGVEKSEGIIQTSAWEHDPLWEDATDAERAYYDRHMALFGNDDYIVGAYYNDFLLWQLAIEKAQSLDPDKIVEALHTYEFESLFNKGRFYGAPRYGIDNQWTTPIWLSEIRSGELVTFAVAPPPDELYPY